MPRNRVKISSTSINIVASSVIGAAVPRTNITWSMFDSNAIRLNNFEQTLF